MEPNEVMPAKKPTLSELLMRSLVEQEPQLEDDEQEEANERERWDADEGSFGG
jgi:hypothetical protein